GDSANDAEIGTREVDQILLYELAHLPFGRVVLASRDRRMDVLAEVPIELHVLGADRILDEVRPRMLDPSTQLNCVRWIETGVDVEADLDVFSESVAHCLHATDRLADHDGR